MMQLPAEGCCWIHGDATISGFNLSNDKIIVLGFRISNGYDLMVKASAVQDFVDEINNKLYFFALMDGKFNINLMALLIPTVH